MGSARGRGFGEGHTAQVGARQRLPDVPRAEDSAADAEAAPGAALRGEHAPGAAGRGVRTVPPALLGPASPAHQVQQSGERRVPGPAVEGRLQKWLRGVSMKSLLCNPLEKLL